jgi:hypothetical protein
LDQPYARTHFYRFNDVTVGSAAPVSPVRPFLPALVQRGSKFCFVVVLLGVRVIAQNIALLSNLTMHSAALPDSLARQPCPADMPGSLARQPCPAALPGSSTNFDRI